MKSFVYKFFFIVFSLLGISISSGAQQIDLGVPFSKYFPSQEYKGGIQNWRISQNSKGFIYIANNYGLLEFDGSSWNRYAIPSNTKLRDVLIDAKDKIYVASQGDFGYFIPDAKGQLFFNSLADSLPSDERDFEETWRVFKDNGRIIFCTFTKIFVFTEAGKLHEIIHPNSDPENFFQVNQKIYICQPEYGISVLNGNVLEKLPGSEFFKGKSITGIIPLSNNRLWIATRNNGIFLYDDGECTTWKVNVSLDLKNSAINDVIHLKNGHILIGTQNDGILMVDKNGNEKLHLNKDKGLQNRTILSLFEDIQGNIWAGHNNGISCVEVGNPFRQINEQAGLPGTGYAAFLHENKLYLGTNNGLYEKNLSQPLGENLEFIRNSNGQVYHISRWKDHILLGQHNGAFEIGDGKAVQLSDQLGYWTFLPIPQKPKYLIAGNYRGLSLFEKKNGDLKFIRKIAGINESCRIMEFDQDNTLWMTHGYKGAYRIQLNSNLDSASFQFYGSESGFPTNLLISVWKINNRLVFTTEEGVYRYNSEKDSFEQDPFFEKYLPGVRGIVKMAEDPMGNIFYISEVEVGALIKQVNGEYVRESNAFNRLKGLLNNDLHNMSVLNTNQVLYAAKEGFIFYDMTDSQSKNYSINTLLRGVWIGFPSDSLVSTGMYYKNGAINFEQDEKYIPSFPFKQNAIRFQFTAPLVDPQVGAKYQFLLENFDKEWSDWVDKTEKEYSNLREGTYTFRVRAKNINNQISEEAQYTFKILSPWYRTTLAYALYSLLIGGLLFACFYWLDTIYRKKTAHMERKQKIELSRKENALKSTEEKIEQLKNEKLTAEIYSKNKELATSAMHLINKNEFINGIKHHLSTLVKRSKNQEVQQEIRKIITNIDKNMEQDKDWENFAIHFDHVHGDFLSAIKNEHPNLSPQEMKLSAYLRMNLSTKEIAQLLNISVRGVEIARYRLRKKLELDREVNLQDYILKF